MLASTKRNKNERPFIDCGLRIADLLISRTPLLVGLHLAVVSAMPGRKEITEQTEKTEQTENFHGFPFVPSVPSVP